jgi:serine phosphatase RsbU (regulator of sigma subunit)
MSLLNMSFLSEAIKEKGIFQPNKVLDYVRERLVDTISSEGQQDGFDGILLCFNKTTNKISYAAANNSPVVVSKSIDTDGKASISHLPYDKMPVGKGARTDNFTLNTIDTSANQYLYLYTDGYADQFGGEIGKKLMRKSLENTLCKLWNLPAEEQKKQLDEKFIKWKGNLEQVDDVCVIGIRLE